MNIDPWFITGFIEGEGAFTYCRTPGGIVCPRFSVRQRHDYGDVLHKVARFFGTGRIHYCKAIKQSQANYYFYISRKADLPLVVRHFEQYPLQSVKKGQAFELWKQLVHLWSNAKGSTKISLIKEEMGTLANTLSTINVRGRPRK